ncbi:MAG: hypothetical protein K2Q12_05085 [Rickettsiales bacterium]|nr:hypothetical protein [Rickettsiales bacterium]
MFGTHLKASKEKKGWLTYKLEEKGVVHARHIGMTQQNGISFIIKPERWYHRILKNIGIAHEMNISDAAFDKKYFITSDYPLHLEQILASGKMLADVKALFALPVKSLHATSHRIWCTIRKEDMHSHDTHYTKQIRRISRISEATQKDSLQQESAGSSRKLGVIAFLFICVHAGLLTVGVFGALPTMVDSNDTVDVDVLVIKGATFGCIVGAVWFLAMMKIFRKSSWVCWVFVDFIMCGIAGFILSGIIFTREANTRLLQPAAQIFSQPITQKICVLKCQKSCGSRCTRHSSYRFQSDATCSPQSRQNIMNEKKNSDYICASRAWYEYTIELEHWRDASLYSFTPSRALFDNVHTSTRLNVPVNEGALGIEWVDTDHIQRE